MRWLDFRYFDGHGSKMKKVQVRQRAWPQDSGQDVKDHGVCFQIRDKLNFHTDEPEM